MGPIAVASGIAIVMVVVVMFMGKGPSKEIRKEILAELNEKRTLAGGDESARKDCVVQLDTLLGKSMKYAGMKGESVGEMLKSARSFFDWNLYDRIWKVHKLRNIVVHEQHVVSVSEVKEAVDVFNSAIRKLLK